MFWRNIHLNFFNAIYTSKFFQIIHINPCSHGMEFFTPAYYTRYFRIYNMGGYRRINMNN